MSEGRYQNLEWLSHEWQGGSLDEFCKMRHGETENLCASKVKAENAQLKEELEKLKREKDIYLNRNLDLADFIEQIEKQGNKFLEVFLNLSKTAKRLRRERNSFLDTANTYATEIGKLKQQVQLLADTQKLQDGGDEL